MTTNTYYNLKEHQEQQHKNNNTKLQKNTNFIFEK